MMEKILPEKLSTELLNGKKYKCQKSHVSKGSLWKEYKRTIRDLLETLVFFFKKKIGSMNYQKTVRVKLLLLEQKDSNQCIKNLF